MSERFTLDAVLAVKGGVVPTEYGNTRRMLRDGRTPLHVEFGDKYADPEAITESDCNDPKRFNAIGSLMLDGSGNHMPVIDADGGADVRTRHGSNKVRLGGIAQTTTLSHSGSGKRYLGKYNPFGD